MKRLIIDIETSPHLAYVWSNTPKYIPPSQIHTPTTLLCFAAKWLGHKRTLYYSSHHNGHDEMVHIAHDLLSEADTLIHYNGTSFDLPHLNREFVLAGLAPPAPYSQVDLYRAAKRRFKFASHKLAYVAEALDIPTKSDPGGFDTWTACLNGDPKAWARMRRYNIQDARVTEALYLRMLPWISPHPSTPLYNGTDGCPTCGEDTLVKDGHAYTATGKYQRYRCGTCGTWARDTRRSAGVGVRGAA